ncbi:Dihydrolipoyllysine-residue acetyltransferase component of pyruvate dehydrogenase complex [bioreactor metagenome]|uniref:Dihydrolipoyllysine-residue acetyltransferase component of pyruvate dehydrogenase complex n=1 Tax=bioreactor metagenome TaxID=1076179 RepID=A0A645IIU9_9ZZZZ
MLGGATFTTTNLGALRIEAFTPIVAPPQTAILGIGCIDYKTRKTADGFSHYPAIGLSLTFDHRAVDGAPAARFLKALCESLEDYIGLLVE